MGAYSVNFALNFFLNDSFSSSDFELLDEKFCTEGFFNGLKICGGGRYPSSFGPRRH